MGTDGSYYWADGRKVPLDPTDQVVVDLGSGSAGSRASLESLRDKGTALSRSLVMVARADADELPAGGTPRLQPVFRAEDGTLVAVLPEVRVEAAPARLDEVVGLLSGAHVTERTEERLVLVPDSGRGEDALRIANELAESGGLEVSQARFVRVVPRPGP